MMDLFASVYLGILLGGLLWIAILSVWLMAGDRDNKRYPRSF